MNYSLAGAVHMYVYRYPGISVKDTLVMGVLVTGHFGNRTF